jgi:predicted dehydrogenase
VIIDQGCHHVRMLRTVVGEIAAVHAFASGRSVNGSAPDTCVVNLTFASGAIGQMLLTWASATPAPGPELQVLGTEGSLEVHISYDQPGGGCARWRRGDSQPVWDATDTDYYDSLDRVIAHWAEVMNGAPSLISLREAIKDMAVTDAITRALASGHRGEIPVPDWTDAE